MIYSINFYAQDSVTREGQPDRSFSRVGESLVLFFCSGHDADTITVIYKNIVPSINEMNINTLQAQDTKTPTFPFYPYRKGVHFIFWLPNLEKMPVIVSENSETIDNTNDTARQDDQKHADFIVSGPVLTINN